MAAPLRLWSPILPGLDEGHLGGRESWENRSDGAVNGQPHKGRNEVDPFGNADGIVLASKADKIGVATPISRPP